MYDNWHLVMKFVFNLQLINKNTVWPLSTRTVVRLTAVVNRRKWFWSPANITGANKVAKISVWRSTTVHILLFCSHTLFMNYVTNTFLLVPWYGVNDNRGIAWQPCCMAGTIDSFSYGKKCSFLCKIFHCSCHVTWLPCSTETFVEFHDHSPLLTKLFCSVKSL